MRVLFLGDVVGRSGRDALASHLPDLKTRLRPDFTVVNAENAAGGYGITDKLAQELLALGIDALTMGNHVWDQKELLGTIEREPRIVRPLNFPDGTPGRGTVLLTNGELRLVVVNVMCRLFMDPLDDPFAAMDRLLRQVRLGTTANAILVDVHGEATSEKQALGHHLDGRVTAVIGTHTHVPTADHRVLPGGTAYQSDAGMCGDYDSVIGMKKEPATLRFVRKLPTERLTPAEGDGTVCGVVIDVDAASGIARQIEPVRLGGRLAPVLPAL